MKNLINLILAFLFMAGCAGMTDRQRTLTECTVTSAALGAGGALIGQLLGKNTESTLWGTLIGSVVSSIVGSIYCNHVADKKAQYASEEAYLKACITSAHNINQETQSYNESLRAEIKRLNTEIKNVKGRYISRQSKEKILKRLERQVHAKCEEAKERLIRANAELKIQQEVLKREKGHSQVMLAALKSEKQKVDAKHSEAKKKLQRAKDEVVIQKEVLDKEKGQSQAELAKLEREIGKLEKIAAELDERRGNFTGWRWQDKNKTGIWTETCPCLQTKKACQIYKKRRPWQSRTSSEYLIGE